MKVLRPLEWILLSKACEEMAMAMSDGPLQRIYCVLLTIVSFLTQHIELLADNLKMFRQ
jgi:hypothetical protein